MTIADIYRDSDDDEDDDEEEPEEEGESEEQVTKEGEVKSEVKDEPGTSKKKFKDTNELRIYHEDELMLFKRDQLLGDVELLDGAYSVCHGTVCVPLTPFP
jgi:hypothetical protein